MTFKNVLEELHRTSRLIALPSPLCSAAVTRVLTPLCGSPTGGFCLHGLAELSREDCGISGTQPLLGRQQGEMGLHFQVDQ